MAIQFQCLCVCGVPSYLEFFHVARGRKVGSGMMVLLWLGVVQQLVKMWTTKDGYVALACT